jgi:hypothetical protein
MKETRSHQEACRGKMRFFDPEDGGIVFLWKHRRTFTGEHKVTSLKIMVFLIILLKAQYGIWTITLLCAFRFVA